MQSPLQGAVMRRNITWGSLVTLLALVALASAGIKAQQTANLVVDPGFETGAGLSDFSAQEAGSTIARSTEAPIAGAASLRLVPEGWGANIWWGIDYTGGLASGLHVSGHLRSDLAS